MPKKPIKWDFKGGLLADATSHIISDFEVYCGKSTATLGGGMSQGAEQNLAHWVMTNLTSGLDNKGHVITMDNFFTSVGLFRDLERRGIYATGTMHSNRIGLHPDMRNIREFRRRGQGDLDWFMHDSKRMCSVLWKDKMPVLLLSTHAPPIMPGNPRDCTVPRRDGALRPDIPTSPVLQEYTKNMRGLDVADHIRGNYTYQVRTHKWWHRIYMFLLDLSTTQIYLYYLEILKKLDKLHEAITHLQFVNGLCQALTQDWVGPNQIGALQLPRYPVIHCPRWTTYRRRCVECQERTQFYCYLCGWEFMCVKEGCYEKHHTPRLRPMH
jgi:hypothetical protein